MSPNGEMATLFFINFVLCYTGDLRTARIILLVVLMSDV